MFEKFLCKIFSGQCQLISLNLDISESHYNTHQCLKLHSLNYMSNKSNDLFQSNCLTLRYLNIRIRLRYFLEHLIEHVPNLEELIVCFQNSMQGSDSKDENLTKSNHSWFSKVR